MPGNEICSHDEQTHALEQGQADRSQTTLLATDSTFGGSELDCC